MKPTGECFDKAWVARAVIRPVDKSEADCFIKFHYLKSWPGVCVLKLGMFLENHLSGIVIFALPPRETAKRYGGATWELARLWLPDWVPQNAETYLISQGVKWIRRFHPEVRCLVSYADPSAGHSGIIYKAANWTADGRTDDDRKTPRFDYAVAGKKYSRRAHVPTGSVIQRIPRVSKARFFYRMK